VSLRPAVLLPLRGAKKKAEAFFRIKGKRQLNIIHSLFYHQG
jgi:hypothetical protein